MNKMYRFVVLLLVISLFSVVAMPAFAESIQEPEAISISRSYQIDYSKWYATAADVIGIDVAELTESTDTIKKIAKANEVKPNKVIKAILKAEKSILKQFKSEMSPEAYKTMRVEVKKTVKAFVKKSPKSYTVPTIQQERLSAFALDTYTYRLESLCCHVGTEHTITVVDGQVTRVTKLDPNAVNVEVTQTSEGVVTTTTVGAEVEVDPSDFLTLDEWFGYIEDKHTGSPYNLSIQFDAALGYPTSIFIDYDRQISDDETHYEITLIQE